MLGRCLGVWGYGVWVSGVGGDGGGDDLSFWGLMGQEAKDCMIMSGMWLDELGSNEGLMVCMV